MYKVISAAPSPYARKVRIALQEKNIPFELITEVPWDRTTQTPAHNPLEKLPILIQPDSDPVFESYLILEYIERLHPDPPLVPPDTEGWLLAKRLEVLSDGVCDAFVLMFFERLRDESKQSAEWMARQQRKIDGGLAEMTRLLGARDLFIGESFTLGDLAVATTFAYLNLRRPETDWSAAYPALAAHSSRMDTRPSFMNTRPAPQAISNKVV